MEALMYIEYTVSFWKEGNQIVGHAMPIDVMSCGYTQSEAEDALDDAVRVFVDRAQEMGTLEEVLAECGYERTAEGWIIPERPVEKQRLMVMSA